MLLARDSIVGISIPSSISLPARFFTRSVIHHPATNSLVTMLARLIVMCISRLGFVTPIVGEVSLGSLGNAHHISLASIATDELVVR